MKNAFKFMSSNIIVLSAVEHEHKSCEEHLIAQYEKRGEND